MTELEHAIKHIKTRADAWAVKEVTEALQSISERLDKALSQEPCDDAINGDVIKTMFPNTEIMITDERVFLRDGTIVMIYPLTWWNAPYQKGGK